MDTTTRGTCWSLTINNPTDADTEAINLARQRGWTVDGQLERGAEGTPHYQLILKTPQVRFSAVKKLFARAHIELARNSKALETYVHKDESRVAGLPVGSDRYPSQVRFFDLVWDEIINNPDGAPCAEYDRKGSGRLFYPTNALNRATHQLIRKGYVVESMASNPMTIATWNQFHDALLARKILGETTRQTDTRLDGEEDPPAMEHNHAVCQEAPPSLSPQAQVDHHPPTPPPEPSPPQARHPFFQLLYHPRGV